MKFNTGLSIERTEHTKIAKGFLFVERVENELRFCPKSLIAENGLNQKGAQEKDGFINLENHRFLFNAKRMVKQLKRTVLVSPEKMVQAQSRSEKVSLLNLLR